MAKKNDGQISYVKHIEPYTAKSETMLPTGVVKFFRTCIIWQFIKFIIINIKMAIVVLKSHK